MNKSLYFIAIIPPKDIRSSIYNYKCTARDQFNSSKALNSPAHITLIPPFNLDDQKERSLHEFLQSFNQDLKPFEVIINGFACFAPKVVYAKIEDSLLLNTIQRKLQENIETFLGIDQKSHFPFHPHMTVAFKDLKKEVFPEAWSYFKKLEYRASFVAEKIYLLKYVSPKWKIEEPALPSGSFLIYKPYGMLSQFTREHKDHVTLADLDFKFPIDVYPVGRLDADSEGLLILSNKKNINDKILNPKNKVAKRYLVQIEGEPTLEDLKELSTGLEIRIKGKSFITQAAKFHKLEEAPDLPDRNPPIRFRKNKPTSWLSLEITEGKNRQVRRMMAKLGFPALRLIRVAIGDYEYGKGKIHKLEPGEVLMIQA